MQTQLRTLQASAGQPASERDGVVAVLSRVSELVYLMEVLLLRCACCEQAAVGVLRHRLNR